LRNPPDDPFSLREKVADEVDRMRGTLAADPSPVTANHLVLRHREAASKDVPVGAAAQSWSMVRDAALPRGSSP
jgi:hypothetical protein